MIKFIQKYQKFFYIAITVVIVISFSFFGTSGVVEGPSMPTQVAFTALDGTKVTRGELEKMTLFLESDLQDKRIYAFTNLSPNFLNDGVIQKDLLETGLAEILIQDYADLFKGELEAKLGREKAFKPYKHPKVPFVSADMVWSYVVPNLKKNFTALQEATNPLDADSLQARVNLYLAERQFPGPHLSQLLQKQQGQHEWLEKDENLPYRDLSLFGYHRLDDWFGSKFTRLAAAFIYNAALEAEKKGYVVSQEEAWADLVKNAGVTYDELVEAKALGTLSKSDYIQNQLRQMGMDSAEATKIWQKVLLFRRLFHDIANAQLIEPETLSPVNAWATESVVGEMYRLPQSLHFSDLLTLAEFESYMDAVSTKNELIPQLNPRPIAEGVKNHPELVQKRYQVAIKEADLKALEARISLRETMDWETDPVHFNQLKKEFADLGIVEGATVEARLAALDNLPDTMRHKVDSFARAAIVAAKQDWVKQALEQSDDTSMTLAVRLKGGKDPLVGVKERKELIDKLDRAPLNEPIRVTGEGKVYEIVVIDRSPNFEWLTFAEARESGVFAQETREAAELRLAPRLQEISKAAGKTLIPDLAASLRFAAWAEQVKKNPALSVKGEDQFKWEKKEEKITRYANSGGKEELFTLQPGEWSPLLTPPNGDLTLFFVKERKAEVDPLLLAYQTVRIRHALGREAEQHFMKGFLAAMRITFNDA